MLERLLRPNRKEAPRKKLRGLRRYFRRVLIRAETYSLDVEDAKWWDFWHHHPDLYGYGNLSWPMRARHLGALAKTFHSFAQQLKQFKEPYQLFISVDAVDASQDAVYVHSRNPNSDDFPARVHVSKWGIEAVSRYFEAMLPGYRLRAGLWEDSKGYFVYCPDVGLPLERPSAVDQAEVPRLSHDLPH